MTKYIIVRNTFHRYGMQQLLSDGNDLWERVAKSRVQVMSVVGMGY